MRDSQTLTGWFHDLASKDRDELRLAATPANLGKLAAHIAVSLPDFSLPEQLNDERFADVIMQLRESERTWNQATMAALIKADDLFEDGRVSDARSKLHGFAAACPWILFKEAALNQAASYERRQEGLALVDLQRLSTTSGRSRAAPLHRLGL